MGYAKRKVTIKWSNRFAYAIGLLATDGCLSKDKRHIDFTSKDLGLVKLFKECLVLDTKIGKKRNGFSPEKKYYRVQIGDIYFYNWLVSIGFSSRKSKTLHFLDIPNEYFFDFLRGCFDGDGSIYSYWDRRWISSFMFYITFCSASEKFILWLQSKNFDLAGIKGHISSGGRALLLKYAKQESVILFKKMFYSENLPYLSRKYKKARKIFNLEKRNNSARVLKLVNRLA